MIISPTITMSTACARPHASWSVSTMPSVMPSAAAYRPWTMENQASVDTQLSVADHSLSGAISGSVSLGHLGFTTNATTGSKRLSPGHLEEVST